MTSTELPNDIDSLKKLVIQKYELMLLEHQRAELFKFRWEKLTRKFFGSSSEKIHEPDGQKLLFTLPQPEVSEGLESDFCNQLTLFDL